MKVPNTAIPTRLKKSNPNWYAVAAVATALQLSADNDVEAKALMKARCIDFKNFSKAGSPSSTSTVLVEDPINYEIPANTILLANDIEERDDLTDLAIKPQYLKEFKIKVAKLKIDRSTPKIFVD